MNEYSITQGQARVWSIIARSFSADRLGSTYLICGPEGYGHWPLALAMAALVNCENPAGAGDGLAAPCGACRSCRLIAGVNFEGLHAVVPIKSHKKAEEAIDLTTAFLEAKRKDPFSLLDTSTPVTIPIDLARELKRSLAQKASEGIRRVAVFYCMERMKAQAADALLKLIEEPPADTTIILTTETPDSLLSTILSRSRRLNLEPLPESYVTEYLIAKYQVSAERARLLSRITNRDLGRAIKMADTPEDEDTSERAVGLLLFKSLFVESSPGMIGLLAELLAKIDRGQAEELIRLWSSLIRDCVAFAGTGRDDDLVNIDFLPDIKRLSRHFEPPEVAAAMTDALKNTLADFHLNVHIHTALAAMALRLQSCVRATA
jgi:DNA polymerase III delta prime subunit